MSEKKRDYINAINRAAEACDDISLLDLVLKIFAESSKQQRRDEMDYHSA